MEFLDHIQITLTMVSPDDNSIVYVRLNSSFINGVKFCSRQTFVKTSQRTKLGFDFVRLLICSFHVRQESMVTSRYWATASYFNTILTKVTGGCGKGRLASFCLEPTTIANDLSLLIVRLLSENHLRTLLTSVWILGIMLSILGPE